MHWGSRECRYSGASRGIGGIRGHLGLQGVSGGIGAGRECRFSWASRVEAALGALGAPKGCRGIGALGTIRGCRGALEVAGGLGT